MTTARRTSSNGNEMTQWLQVENLTLGGDTTVGWVRFWTIEDPNLNSYDGNIQYWIFGDGWGIPGSVLATGNIVNPSRSFTGNIVLDFYEEHVYELDISRYRVVRRSPVLARSARE